MKKKKLSEKQKNKIDEEIANITPKNRTEAKIQLSAKLRIEKRKRSKERRNSPPPIEVLNAMRFEQGMVPSFDIARVETTTKKWRGKGAN